jgi:NADPH:quinone reductase
MPQSIRAVVVDPSSDARLTLRDVELAPAAPGDVTVRVTAISLNRGEVNRALSASEAGARPGWDFAGVIEAAAADGSGPPVGTRVVGMLPTGAWAERLRAPSNAVAALPDGVSDAQAATLPVAGLTALHALRQGGLLLGRKVLVDGATGGVGHLAVQLAAASGAVVYGQVRRPEQKAMIAEWCGDRVIVAADLRAAASSGPYHLILDSIGGSALSAALTMLQPNGTCVHFGVSASPTSTIESGAFFRQGGVKLYGLILFHELRQVEPAGPGLAVLAQEVLQRRLRPHIEIEAPWTDIAGIARRLLAREFVGKAVLHVT